MTFAQARREFNAAQRAVEKAELALARAKQRLYAAWDAEQRAHAAVAHDKEQQRG